MKMLRALCATAVFAATWALPAQAEDLLQVFEHAQMEDAQLRAAEAQYRAVLEARPIARSTLLPQLSADAELGAFYSDPDGSSSIDGSSHSIGLNLNQSLFDQRNRIGVRQADLQISSAAAELDAARQDLILRVAEAYFGVLVARETLEFRRAEREAISRQLEQTQRRFEVGLIAITDVKEAQAQFDIASAEQIAAENALNLAREQLAVITNRYYDQLAALGEHLDMPSPDPMDPQDWVSAALENNQELNAQRLSAEVAREQIGRQRAEGLPTLGLGASVSDTGYSGVNSVPGGQFNDRTDAQIGLRLDVPLYTGGRVSAITREAREQFEAAQETVVFTQRQTVQNTRNSYLSVIANASRARALAQALQSTQAAFESAQAGFEVGTRTQVDVLLALREVFRAERDYAEARYGYLLETLRLQRAVGSLSLADLQRINAFLE
ncbi:Type I secretion outer membrane protein, TolC precursor [Thioalkalivibrio nitratireducens DSM 14787]|uniref:Type I secretion outer membrane protein, TolC n=1 Tax=Thioalkalivibrio nitratireducens (strain DSM 14787 / UNIQEM 213 / ALEN2) TaxID=1255043 RepID=L0E223_THIND|nr:TolC family outer membrane protein [Thioalkalivibrio nitratireducens]AGA35260.1 Type I secretion outer membrane protein, TolC precursor [Thioalkalivibrio nitratireducens DSM 14787]